MNVLIWTSVSVSQLSKDCPYMTESPALLGFSGACFVISLFLLVDTNVSIPFFLAFVFISPLLHFVVLCSMVYQIEMAIETLQKSEGLSSQRSSLLNSHVSCFYECLPSQFFFLLLSFSLNSIYISVWCGSCCFCWDFNCDFRFKRCCRNAFAEVWWTNISPRSFHKVSMDQIVNLLRKKQRLSPCSSSGCWTITRQQRA